jgi:hypothetical protein
MKVNFTTCCIFVALNELLPDKVIVKMPYKLMHVSLDSYLLVEKLHAS